ncbi:MAG: hypothetical protein JXQ82_10230 [Methanomicrobiaceae archaeon]|nr:hypothetical protein [Methanomicrobiaceae archaeon]
MQTPHRDRCKYRIASLCIALIILSASVVFSVSGLNAHYYVYDNATGYHAAVEIEDCESYEFIQPGVLGEKIPLQVSNITLYKSTGSNATFEDKGRSISFEKGNYTAAYDAELKNKDFQVILSSPYNVTLYLPQGYDVKNPLLGMVSTGGIVSTIEDGDNETITIEWTKKMFCEARFYDAFQVEILTIFGTFWIALVAVFLVPYLMTRKKKE